jgi:type IV pilus assembly protein PilY1
MAGLISRARPLVLTALVAAVTVVPGTAPVAAPLALADVPLFLSTDVTPNLIMAIDDSQSMDSEVLLRTNDGAAWWRTDAPGPCAAQPPNSFVGCGANSAGDLDAPGSLNFNYGGNAAGPWKKFVYLFPNGYRPDNDTDRRRGNDAGSDHYAIPPLPQFAWARSSVHNSLYFNPAVTYAPWQSGGGYTFNNANVNAARYDPVFNPPAPIPSDPFTPTINLEQDFAGTRSAGTGDLCGNASLPQVQPNYYFRVYRGMNIPFGACIRRPYGDNRDWVTVESATGCNVGDGTDCQTSGQDRPIDHNTNLAIRYFPATFYLRSATDLPAGYGYIGPTLTGEAPDGSALVGFEIKLSNFGNDATKYQAALQNFANWFAYHRKRHQALRAGLGKAFVDIARMRIAGFTINQADSGTPPDVTMKNIDDGTNRSELYTQFYHDWVRTGGTPNRPAVANIIRNLRRTGAGAPIQYACQKNFGMLFTDGFTSPSSTFDGLNNVDGAYPAPYHDDVGGTMADGVMDAYANNLRPDMPAGKVPVPNDCRSAPNPRLDCNRDQHMNFYAITLDSRGVQFDPDNPVDPYVTPPAWPAGFPQRHPSAVDDLWHATVNGRGLMLNARGADEIAARLKEVLRNIVDLTSSASAAAVNSGIISSDTRVYQARFSTTHWTGELLSFAVDPPTGQVRATPEWDASKKLPESAARNIFTVNESNAAAAFRRAALSDLRQRQLTGTPAASPLPADTVIDTYVDYIRGTDAAGFRVRPSKLGDIVSSAPLYVGAPRGRYSDRIAAAPYSEFVEAQADRTPMIYVGANDGMLHAIDAGSGEEEWAFIPGAVFGNLVELTKPTYTHRYFVDGAPNVGDAYFSGAWHSVLVGGLNNGGRSIYALDVTDPTRTSEADALDMFMWEFQDADLGYSFSQPAVVRLHNGQWAAVFGNGYNNTGSGTAALFVVDIRTGSVIRKFDTEVGAAADPNGMATPVLVDVDGDRIVDHAYAGDLRGNLWKIDLRATDAADWAFAFEGAGGPQPLFTALNADGTAQPITTRPEVARGPYGAGVIVLVGTGKYVETTDNQVGRSEPTQSFYGLIDANTYTDSDRIESRAELVEQTIQLNSFDPDGAAGPKPAIPVRTVTDNKIAGAQTGWFMDLPVNGERQITDPVVRSDRLIFTTLIPKSDPCSFGGSSWLMEVDLLNGGTLPSAPLDTNGDGVVDEHDLLPDGSVPSGLPADEYLSRPALLADFEGDGPDQKISSGSSGELRRWAESADHGGRGRQSWRQIR